MSYSDEVKSRLGQIILTLLDLLKSKKFLAALGGAVTTYQTTGDPMVFLWASLAFVAAQGIADFGKEGATINAAAALPKQPARPSPQATQPLNPAVLPGKPIGALLTPNLAKLLIEAGFPTVESVKAANDSEIVNAGLTPPQVAKVREIIR